jgi:hypothetical protein
MTKRNFNPWRSDTANTHKPHYARALVNRPNPTTYSVLGKGTTTKKQGVVLCSVTDGGRAFDLANSMPEARGYGAGDDGDDRVFYVLGAQVEEAAEDAVTIKVAPAPHQRPGA